MRWLIPLANKTSSLEATYAKCWMIPASIVNPFSQTAVTAAFLRKARARGEMTKPLPRPLCQLANKSGHMAFHRHLRCCEGSKGSITSTTWQRQGKAFLCA